MKSRQPSMAALYRLASIGIDAVVTVGVLGGLGYLLDRWLGTRWIVVLGGVLGVIVAMVKFVRDANRVNRSMRGGQGGHARR